MPSFTRSGRPSASFASRPPSGQHVDGVPRQVLEHRRGYTSGRSGAVPEKASAAETPAHPQAQTARPPLRPRAARARGVLLRRAHRDRGAELQSLDPSTQQHAAGAEHVRLRERRHDDPRDPARLAGAHRRPVRRDLAVAEARDRRDRGQALLRAPRDRPARHLPRCRERRPRPRRCRAARRSRSSSSRTRSTGSAPTLGRKLREAALAWQLEQHWSKDWILTAYLNTIYFGNGAYGVEQACRIYFGHGADDGRARPRRRCSPGSPRTRASTTRSRTRPRRSARRNLVLRQMYEQHYLDRAAVPALPSASRCRSPQDVRLPATQSDAGAVLRELRHRPARAPVRDAGRLRRRAAREDDDRPRSCRRSRARRSRSALPPSVGPTAALVALDAHTGAVLAMVGGRNYHQQPVQPRDAGRAPAGLVVQAVRARGGARGGDRAVDDARLAADHDRHRRPRSGR